MPETEIERLRGCLAVEKWKAQDAENRVEHWKSEHRKAMEGLKLAEDRVKRAEKTIGELLDRPNADVFKQAIRNICAEVGQHDTRSVSADKLQTTVTEVHCICLKAMPELDDDREKNDDRSISSGG